MIKNIKDFDVHQKRILARCDFDVALDDHGNIVDDFRLKMSLPTIQYLMKQKASIILMGHLGEPEGVIVPHLTLNKVKEALEKLLGKSISKLNDCIGEEVKTRVANMVAGEIVLLENVRFHKQETENDLSFAKQLASLGDMYVNDAFAVCHRAHASIALVPTLLPSCAGLSLGKEIEQLSRVLENPQKPLVVVMGGKKVQTKAQFIEKMLQVGDTVIVSGLIKKEMEQENMPFRGNAKILSPSGVLDMLDINDETIVRFTGVIEKAKTVVWNGPFGKFENPHYQKGTLAIAKAIIKSKAFSVVGGGETIAFLDSVKLTKKFSHVSTGGGSMLEFLSGETLPGIRALQ